MQTTGSRPKLVVSADGRGVVSHAGSRLLADLADTTGLIDAFNDALRRLRPRGTGHDPGRIAVDVAVMLADGGVAISDLALLRDQPEVFGPVASTPTVWRLLAGLDPAALAALRSARAAAREVAWLQATETKGGIPAARAGGRDLPGLVLDIDATLVTCHSEKEQAAPTYKRGFGYHPLLCFLDNSPACGGETPTGEALAGVLRPGNAGANTAADHITVLDRALAHIPDTHRHGTPILVRANSARGAKTFLAHLRALRQRGIQTSFSVGYAITEPVRRAIRALPDRFWHPALEQDGTLRAGAEVAELTGMVDLAGLPDATRVIVRRERPHPGAQLSLFDLDEGMRHQAFLTDTPRRRRLPAVSGGPPPRSRPRRGPHPLRKDHRLRPVPLPPLRDQYCVAGTGPDRHRPARLGPDSAAGRRVGHRRAEEAPLPPAACSSPHYSRRATPPPADRRHLALAKRAGHSIHPPRGPAQASHLT